MIRYDTQSAYGGTASRTDLIQAANRMSPQIEAQRPKKLTEAQSASIRQEEEFRSFAVAEMNCFSTFDTSSRSFIVQRDKLSKISMRRLNGSWIERSKRESGNLSRRFKKNTTSSLGRCGVTQSYSLHLRACSIRVYRTITHRQGLLRPAVDL